MVSLVDLPTREWIVCTTTCIATDEGIWTRIDVRIYVGEALAENLNLLIVRPERYVCCLGLLQTPFATKEALS